MSDINPALSFVSKKGNILLHLYTCTTPPDKTQQKGNNSYYQQNVYQSAGTIYCPAQQPSYH